MRGSYTTLPIPAGLVVIPVIPRFRHALVSKMLLKPFIVVNISDSDRVLLDITKAIMPSMEGGDVDKKWNVPLPAAI